MHTDVKKKAKKKKQQTFCTLRDYRSSSPQTYGWFVIFNSIKAECLYSTFPRGENQTLPDNLPSAEVKHNMCQRRRTEVTEQHVVQNRTSGSQQAITNSIYIMAAPS